MSVQCGKSAALGASLGVGPAPKVVCRSKSATPPSSPFLLGTASPWSNLAAIPPHRSRDESRPQCSGQPGYGRPGRWRRQCQSSQICSATNVAAQNPRCQPQTARSLPHQRRCVVLLFDGQCLFAWTVVPRFKVCARSLLWAVPAQAPEAVCPSLLLPVFAGVWEPEVSQPLRRQSQSALPLQTASRAKPPLPSVAPAPWSLADSLPAPAIPRSLPPSMRLPTTKAPILTYASASVTHRAPSPARPGEKGFIYILQGAAADAAVVAYVSDF